MDELRHDSNQRVGRPILRAPSGDRMASAASSVHVLHESGRVSDLIASIYASTTDLRGWSAFAEQLAHALDLRAVDFVLSSRAPDGRLGFVPASYGIDEADLARYQAYYVHCDPHLEPSFAIPNGTVVRNAEVVPDEELVKSEFFNDFYRGTLGLRHGFAGMIHNQGLESSVIVCHRGHDQPAPSDLDLELLELLTHHLQSARSIALQLGSLQEILRISVDMLDRFSVGAVFLDRSGQVMHANARAQAILRANDGLGLSDERLCAARHSDTKALDAVVASAAALTQGETNCAPTSVRLPRPSGRRPLDVTALPIGRRSNWWSEIRAAACLIVNDGEAELAGAAHRLTELYQLSPVEAELAVAISMGVTVRDWADHRGVSVETVRWQLKQVFAKTGTSRQPELMRLVLLGPGLLR